MQEKMKKIVVRIISSLAVIGLLLGAACGLFWWSYFHAFERSVLDAPRTVGEKQPLSLEVSPAKCRWHKTLNVIVYTDTFMHDVAIDKGTVFLGGNRTLPSQVTLSAQDKKGKSYQAVLKGYLAHKLVFSFSDEIPRHTPISRIMMCSEKDIVVKSMLWLDCTPY
jgi:hypothetical protein